MHTVARRCPPSVTRCGPIPSLNSEQTLTTTPVLLPMPTSPQPVITTTTSSSVTITPSNQPLERPVSSSSSSSNVRSCPRLRGLDALLMFALVGVIAVSSAALAIDWQKNDVKQLRSWLIVYLFLLVVRVCGRTAVEIFPRDRWLIAGRLFTVFLWIFTIVSFVWFIIGVVWVSQVEQNVRPFLWYVVCILIGMELCIAGSWILLGLLVFLFALQPVLTSRNRTPAATAEDLEKLRTFKYVADRNNTTESAPVCSICLCEYQPDDMLRELPCAVGAHTFHASCVDEWLLQKLSCPICRDDPLHKNQQSDQDEGSESRRDMSAV